MLYVGNFSACVTIGGQELDQYGVDIDGNMATCWIVSEAGKVSVTQTVSDGLKCPARRY